MVSFSYMISKSNQPNNPGQSLKIYNTKNVVCKQGLTAATSTIPVGRSIFDRFFLLLIKANKDCV